MNKYDDYTDLRLVLAFQDGDSEALSELLNRYQDRLYHSIFYMVKDHQLAEDLCQDVLVRVIDKLQARQYNEEGKLFSWMMRIAHNMCIDYFRRQKRMPVVAGDQGDLRDVFDALGIGIQDDPETTVIRHENYAAVTHALEQLPAAQREVIVLRHYADMSFKEIARITNCSINTALGRMRYGLINMRKIFDEQSFSI